jgi:hypothetical protein
VKGEQVVQIVTSVRTQVQAQGPNRVVGLQSGWSGGHVGTSPFRPIRVDALGQYRGVDPSTSPGTHPALE